MALARRLCLVLCGMCAAGLFLLVVRFKTGSISPFRPPSWTYVKPALFTEPPPANVTQDTFTLVENQEITKCIEEFPKLRFENKLINRPNMEKTRVYSHSYLNRNSRVIEVGGYTGEDAAKLIRKYDPYYTAMEPIPRYQRILTERYKQNPKFKVLGIGLGKENKTLHLNIDSDATSLFRKKDKSQTTTQEVAHIRELTQVFRDLEVQQKTVDLISINCEGCEYDLLEVLATSKLAQYFRNIQFQFHLDLPGISNQEGRYCEIMTLLSRTHTPTFQFGYTWQSWKRRSSKTLFH